VGIFEHGSFLFLCFGGDVITEKAGIVLFAVGRHACELEGRFFGEGGGRPDLSMGVWVGAAHSAAFVFEDLHVGVLACWGGRTGCGEVVGACDWEMGAIDGSPSLDDRDNGGGGEVCKSSMVVGRLAKA